MPVRERSISEDLDAFRKIRFELRMDGPEAAAPKLRDNATLAIGVLMGGGFPGCAATLAVLLEERFPEITHWPWNLGQGNSGQENSDG
jgi:hypothetical protein